MTEEQASLSRALACLHAGELVAIPTETVYGLAADASRAEAVAKIFALKGRPANHPLIVHLGHGDQAKDWAQSWPDRAVRLAACAWPGPLTLVLPRAARVPLAVTGGQESVALRVPAQPLTLRLLQAWGGGLAAPSANRFGRVSPTTAQHVRDEFGSDAPWILDGGACAVGVESTIVSLIHARPTLLRPGGVSVAQLEAWLGERLVLPEAADTLRVPGRLQAHYAPRTPMLALPLADWQACCAAQRPPEGAVLSWAPYAVPAGWAGLTLPGDAGAYAQGLYAAMRALDAEGHERLWVVPPPAHPDWLAVHDRLRRAVAAFDHALGTNDA
jgi:L-threonylcarbamoyladenylate synthase